jgi:hypothetical protein
MPEPSRTSSASSRKSTVPALEPGFLRSVHLASALLGLLLGLFIAFYHDGSWGLGFVLASSWSTANVWALGRLIQLALRPSGRNGRLIALAALLKIPVLYGLLFLLVTRGGFAAGALLTGFSVPFVVILLKAGGRLLAGSSRAVSSPSDTRRTHTS